MLVLICVFMHIFELPLTFYFYRMLGMLIEVLQELPPPWKDIRFWVQGTPLLPSQRFPLGSEPSYLTRCILFLPPFHLVHWQLILLLIYYLYLPLTPPQESLAAFIFVFPLAVPSPFGLAVPSQPPSLAHLGVPSSRPVKGSLEQLEQQAEEEADISRGLEPT